MDHATHLEPVVHRDWPAIGWEEQSWVPSVVWALSTDLAYRIARRFRPPSRP